MDCSNCRNKSADPVPFAVFECVVSSHKRTVMCLWVVILVLAVMLFGSNLAWVYYESQWEVVQTTETYEATTDGGGTAIINGDGVVDYGSD